MVSRLLSKSVSREARVIMMVFSGLSGSLSIVGSSLVIFIILRRKALALLRNRLLFMLSIFDFISSIFMSLYVLPSTSTNVWGEEVEFAMGNKTTCAIQGFALMLGGAVPAYNAMLSLYYLATIRYNIEESILVRKYELVMHLYSIIPSVAIAIAGAIGNVFASNGSYCWLHPAEPSSTVFFIISGALNSFSGITIIGSMSMTYYTVRSRERQMNRYGFSSTIATTQRNAGSQPNDVSCLKRYCLCLRFIRRRETTRDSRNDATRKTFNQALLYTAGFFLTYIWTSILMCVALVDNHDNGNEFIILDIFQSVFLPLQGFWNFLAFIRPRFVLFREEDPSLDFYSALKKVILDKTVPNPPVIRHVPESIVHSSSALHPIIIPPMEEQGLDDVIEYPEELSPAQSDSPVRSVVANNDLDVASDDGVSNITFSDNVSSEVVTLSTTNASRLPTAHRNCITFESLVSQEYYYRPEFPESRRHSCPVHLDQQDISTVSPRVEDIQTEDDEDIVEHKESDIEMLAFAPPIGNISRRGSV